MAHAEPSELDALEDSEPDLYHQAVISPSLPWRFVGWLGSDDLYTGAVKASEVVRVLQDNDLFVAALYLVRGADVIFDPVGGDLFDDCLRCVAWNGRVLVIGFASGSIQKIPANLPLLKGSSIIGVFWGKFTECEPQRHRENTRALVELLAAGRVRPYVAEVFPLAKAATAIARLASRQATGKVIVRIA